MIQHKNTFPPSFCSGDETVNGLDDSSMLVPFLPSICSEDEKVNGLNDSPMLAPNLPSMLSCDETGILSDTNNFTSNLLQPTFKPVPTFSLNETILGRYTVKDINKGGFGEVYHCYDNAGKRDVALKTVLSERKKTSTIFNFYTEISMRLEMRNHPNVLQLRKVEMIRGYPYLVSDWIEGDPVYGNTLRDWMNKKRLTQEEVFRFGFHILFALKTCHEQFSTNGKDYVYKDLKPENVAISKDHKGILMDFSVGASTIGYKSPEQIAGLPLDFRHDIYDFGLVLEEMVKQSDLTESEKATLHPVVLKCKDQRELRYASFEDLQSALQEKAKYLNIEIPVDEQTLPPSSLDSYYIWCSKLSLGTPTNRIPQFDSSRYTKNGVKIPSMNDYIEYVRTPDLWVFEADAYLYQGDYAKARESLSRVSVNKKTQLFHFVEGKLYFFEHDIEHALEAFRCANDTSLHLYSLDFLIDVLNQYPTYRKQNEDFLQKMYTRLKGEVTNRPDGSLLFSVYGKLCMLLGHFSLASNAFKESLTFPSYDSWNTNYHLGICEQNQNHIYQATAHYSRAISEVKIDQNYRTNLKKATTMLFSLLALSRIQEAEEEMVLIRENFKLDYSALIDSLRNDLLIFDKYQRRINECGKETELLSNLFEEFENIQMSCTFLKIQILIAIAIRIMSCCFQGKNYMNGISVGERTRKYDVLNPNLLYNLGSCYYMNGQHEEAINAYHLALQVLLV